MSTIPPAIALSSLDAVDHVTGRTLFEKPTVRSAERSFPFHVEERGLITPLYKIHMSCARGHYSQPPHKSLLTAELCHGTPYIDTAAVFLYDTEPTIKDSILEEWDRYYARIPTNHSVTDEIAWTRPGINTLLTGEDQLSVSATQVQSNPYSSSYDAVVSVSDTTGFAVGDRIEVRYSTVFGYAFNQSTGSATISYISGSALGIEDCTWISSRPPGTIYSADLVTLIQSNSGGNVLEQRDEKAIVASGYRTFEFFLDPDPADIDYPKPFEVTQDGSNTNILTTASDPTIAAYKTDVVAKKYLQVGEAKLTRWKGPIYQLVTPFALAS